MPHPQLPLLCYSEKPSYLGTSQSKLQGVSLPKPTFLAFPEHRLFACEFRSQERLGLVERWNCKPGTGSWSLPGPILPSLLEPLPALQPSPSPARRGSVTVPFVSRKSAVPGPAQPSYKQQIGSIFPLVPFSLGQIAVVPMLPLGAHSPQSAAFSPCWPVFRQ